MAVAADGSIEGSVSAGCIDGAAAFAAQEVLADGRPRLLAFGSADDDGEGGVAWDVDLPCGGAAEILVEKVDDAALELCRRACAQGRPVVRVAELVAVGAAAPEDGVLPAPVSSLTFAEGEDPAVREALVPQVAFGGAGGFGAPDAPGAPDAGALDPRVARRALARFDHAAHTRADVDAAGTVELDGARLFVQRAVPAPRLVLVGATHIAQALCDLAATMGWRVTVVDPRAAFAAPARFPRAERVVADWPQRALPGLDLSGDCAVCALSHDEKIDVPALDVALGSDAFYIGCLGRPSTQLERRRALLDLGRTDGDLARVHGPIGVWTGGCRPEDIALSAMAQMAAVRNGTVGRLGAASDRRLAQMDEDYVRAYDARPRKGR